MSAWEDMVAYVNAVKNGGNHEEERRKWFAKKSIPLGEIKAELLENPEVRAEYERLRPEFGAENKRIQARAQQEVPRFENGRRVHLMDYIPDKQLYAAVRFALDKIQEGTDPAYAVGWAANQYRVKKSDVGHYVGQNRGTRSGRRQP
jgi:hypothetical protein